MNKMNDYSLHVEAWYNIICAMSDFEYHVMMQNRKGVEGTDFYVPKNEIAKRLPEGWVQ